MSPTGEQVVLLVGELPEIASYARAGQIDSSAAAVCLRQSSELRVALECACNAWCAGFVRFAIGPIDPEGVVRTTHRAL